MDPVKPWQPFSPRGKKVLHSTRSADGCRKDNRLVPGLILPLSQPIQLIEYLLRFRGTTDMIEICQ